MFLSNISITRPVFTVMVILALVVFGYISYSRLGIDLMPNVEFGYVTISTVYPGADPETVETEIIDPIEDEIATLPGIKSINSRAIENVGIVIVEYELEINVDIAAQDLRARLEAIKSTLPEDAKAPLVEKLDIGSSAFMSMAISADMPLTDLTKFVKDQIKPRFESVNGVGSVVMVGGREREIHVLVNPDKMRERNIGIDEINAALMMSNIEIPGGRIETGTREFIVKTKGRIPVSSEFKNIILKSSEGGVVRLNDVAEVQDTLEDKRTLARLDGKDAIGLLIRKKSKANTVEVADKVNETIKKLQAELPSGIRITVPSDESIFIRSAFEELLKHLFYGGFFAVLIVFLFLRSPRSTLISAVAIPTSILSTFSFMYAMGFTLNMLTMLGLSLSVGMLIDDAIVVLENIFRHMEDGEKRMDAARNATTEIGLAVMATTFSIVAVFVPVAFTYGIVGRFMYQFGMTVSVAVLISLFVSFTLTPMLASKFLVVSESRNRLFKLIERGLKGMDNGYRGFLRGALRRKPVTIILAIAIFIFSLFLGSRIPMEFQSKQDQEMFAINLYTPPGSPITTVEEKIKQVETILKKDLPGLKTIFSTVGGGSAASVNEASITIGLVKKNERKEDQFELMALARQKLSALTGVKVALAEGMGFQSGFRGGELEILLQGEDIDKIVAASDKLIEEWKKLPGFVDVDKSFESGKPELRLLINRDRASDLGLSVIGIASTVNGLVSGENPVTTFKEAGKDYDVKVRLEEKYRNEPNDLLALPVRSMKGALIDLGSVAQIQPGSGPSEIIHNDRLRTVTVFTNLDGIPLGTAKQETNKIISGLLPPGVSYKYSGMSDIMEESFRSLFFSMGLAILIIYMLLASQFENFFHPLAIMLSLPLSLVGALGALFLSGMTINIITMIGLIMLMGLVTKNAILLVDYTNTLRREHGMEREEALLAAGPIRLRPILMTTSAMVFGMLPVALALGSGSEMQAPMAICVIGGLITSTILTLVVVPVAYSILDRWVEGIAHRFNK